ncbi:MAG: bifunctional oligoribonuclease/PAP phosphatase NrnA [Treponema sp.]|nr:bifunctional oligoribonuclease/PAP phosphatase NrnA [Treponema sp.]
MEYITQDEVVLFKSFIEQHDFFYIIGHKEPDGDAIGSCIGLSHIVKAFGKQYQLLSAGPFKRTEISNYSPLFSSEMTFLTSDERKNAGLIIADCSEFSRLGDIEGDLKNLDTFIIDHHKTSSCPENAKAIIYPTSPATCVLVQLLYEKILGPVPKDCAEILFFGICTDTGFFRFLDNLSSSIFESTARLIKAGANPRTTYESINSGKPFSTRKLLGTLLSRAEQHLNGKLILTYETMEDTHLMGQDGRDTDALYSILLSSKNVEAVAVLRQETPFNCTGGFRSKDKVDVSIVASKFGGGGHKNASGMSCEGKLDTLLPAVVKEFARIMS